MATWLRVGIAAALVCSACTPACPPQPQPLVVAPIEPTQGDIAPLPSPAPPLPKTAPVVVNDRIAWVVFSRAELDRYTSEGRTVFVHIAADWCLNCQVLNKTVIETAATREALIEANVVPMRADFTNEDEEIEAYITELKRGGIPLDVVVTPDGEHKALNEALTIDELTTALRNAVAP